MPAGRFAPSPTGPLHLGSLLAAVASYLAARQQGLQWLVRIDDLDAPRNQPGADREIIESLHAHGLYPDRPPIYQSQRTPHYALALNRLIESGRCFYCRCARKSLPRGEPYPGACRAHQGPRDDSAVRYRVGTQLVEFDDLIEGPQKLHLGHSPGDFIVRRRDGIFAYHLACAVDDGEDEIVQVVRGRDLLEQTGPQLALMQALGLKPPTYAHLPLVTHNDGSKLSKQSHATPLNNHRATENLQFVLNALGVTSPSTETQSWHPDDWLTWGTQAFKFSTIDGGSSTTAP